MLKRCRRALALPLDIRCGRRGRLPTGARFADSYHGKLLPLRASCGHAATLGPFRARSRHHRPQLFSHYIIEPMAARRSLPDGRRRAARQFIPG
jgi:hypothetical protein